MQVADSKNQWKKSVISPYPNSCSKKEISQILKTIKASKDCKDSNDVKDVKDDKDGKDRKGDFNTSQKLEQLFGLLKNVNGN